MISDSALIKICELAAEVSAREGCTLYDVEFTGQGRGRVLRIYVDGSEKGVTIDQCASISRGLSLLLDVEDPIPGGRYELEVSSPGVERPLRQPWHFKAALGEQVKLKLERALERPEGAKKGGPVKNLIGKIMDVEDDCVVVETLEGKWPIEFSQIAKANLVFSFERKAKPGSSKK